MTDDDYDEAWFKRLIASGGLLLFAIALWLLILFT